MDDRFPAAAADHPDPDSERSVRQIERLLADHDVEGARLAFELTAWGAAASADSGQLARLRAAAEALGLDPEAPETLGLTSAPAAPRV